MIINYENRFAPIPLSPAMALLANEAEGLAIDFVSGQAFARGSVAFEPRDINGYINYPSPSTKNIWNGDGVLESGTLLRCDHDGAGNPLGVRIEPQSTNLVTRSEALHLPPWQSISAGNTVCTEGVGGFSRLEFLDESTDRRMPLGHAYSVQAGGITFSVQGRFKPGPGITRIALGVRRSNGVFGWMSYDLLTKTSQVYTISTIGTFTFVSCEQMPDGSWLLKVTWTSYEVGGMSFMAHFGTGTAINLRNASPIGYCDIGYVQAEIAGVPSSYTKTEDAQVTRSADVLSLPIAAFQFRQAGGTLIADFTPVFADNGASNEFTVANLRGSNTNYAFMVLVTVGSRTGQPRAELRSVSSSASVWSVNGGNNDLSPPGLVRQKWAMSYDASALRFSRLGLPVGSGEFIPNIGSDPLPTPSTLYIGASINGVAAIGGWMRSLIYVPRLMTLQELNARTAL